jgi:hypothetical protein
MQYNTAGNDIFSLFRMNCPSSGKRGLPEVQPVGTTDEEN